MLRRPGAASGTPLLKIVLCALGVAMLLPGASFAIAPEDVMFRQLSTGAGDERPCLCFNGSSYGYWYSPGAPDTWVVYFHGGPIINSLNNASEVAPEYLSVPNTDSVLLNGDFGDILSRSSTENPGFANATRVILPSCHLDGWVGASSTGTPGPTSASGATTTQSTDAAGSSNEKDTGVFCGFTCSLRVLVDVLGLVDRPPAQVVIAVRSANGVGASAHAAALAKALDYPPWSSVTNQVLLVMDSVWAVNHDDILTDSRLNYQDALEFYQPPADLVTVHDWVGAYKAEFARLCRKRATRMTDTLCCLVPECMLRELGAQGDRIRVALLAPKYDPYPIFFGLLRGAAAVQPYQYLTNHFSVSVQELSDLTNSLEEYSGATIEALSHISDNAGAAFPPIMIIATACLQHGMMAQTQLDLMSDGILEPQLLDLRPMPTTWTNLVPGTNASIQALVTSWLQQQASSTESAFVLDAGPSAFLVPPCKGLACHESCPSIFSGSTSATLNEWLSSKDLGFTVFAGIVLVIVFALGIMASIRSYWLLRKFKNMEAESSFLALAKRPSGVGTFHQLLSKILRRARSKRSAVLLSVIFTRLHRSERIGFAAERLNYWTPGKRPKQILNNVSVFANPCEMTAIMGPSGCGKTTLLDVLVGRRTAGHIKGKCMVNGRVLWHKEEERILKHRIAYVEQRRGAFFDDMTVKENAIYNAMLRLPASMASDAKILRALSVLRVVELLDSADKVVASGSGGLSGGQKRRLAVAMELLQNPAVLAMDEPTSGLDSSGTRDFMMWLRKFAKTGRTILVSIHQPRQEVFHLFHRVILMEGGHVVGFDKPSHLLTLADSWRREEEQGSLATVRRPVNGFNPADLVLDQLQKPELRNVIRASFQKSGNRARVERSIRRAETLVNQAVSVLQTPHNGSAWSRDSSGVLSLRKVQNKEEVLALFLPSLQEGETTARPNPLRKLLLLCSRFLKRLPLKFFAVMALKVLSNAAGYSWLYSNASEAYVLLSCNFSLMFGFPFLLANSFSSRIMSDLETFRVESQLGVATATEAVMGIFIAMSASVLPLCFALYHVVYAFVYWDKTQGQRLLMLTLLQLLNVQVLNSFFIFLCGMCHRKRLGARHALAYFTSFVGVFAALSGFLVSPGDATTMQLVLYHISPLFYVFSVCAKVSLEGLVLSSCADETGVIASFVCTSQSPSSILEVRGYDTVGVGSMVGVLLAWNGAFLLLASMAISETPLPTLQALPLRHPSVWQTMTNKSSRSKLEPPPVPGVGDGGDNPHEAETAGKVFVLPAVRYVLRERVLPPRRFTAVEAILRQERRSFMARVGGEDEEDGSGDGLASLASTPASTSPQRPALRPKRASMPGQPFASRMPRPRRSTLVAEDAHLRERSGLERSSLLQDSLWPSAITAIPQQHQRQHQQRRWHTSRRGLTRQGHGAVSLGDASVPSSDGQNQAHTQGSQRSSLVGADTPRRHRESEDSIQMEMPSPVDPCCLPRVANLAVDSLSSDEESDTDDSDGERDMQAAQNEMMWAITGVFGGRESTRALASWLSAGTKDRGSLLKALANPHNRWQDAVRRVLVHTKPGTLKSRLAAAAAASSSNSNGAGSSREELHEQASATAGNSANDKDFDTNQHGADCSDDASTSLVKKQEGDAGEESQAKAQQRAPRRARKQGLDFSLPLVLEEEEGQLDGYGCRPQQQAKDGAQEEGDTGLSSESRTLSLARERSGNASRYRSNCGSHSNSSRTGSGQTASDRTCGNTSFASAVSATPGSASVKGFEEEGLQTNAYSEMRHASAQRADGGHGWSQPANAQQAAAPKRVSWQDQAVPDKDRHELIMSSTSENEMNGGRASAALGWQ